MHFAQGVADLLQWDTIKKKQRDKQQAIQTSKDNAIKEASMLYSPAIRFYD